MFFKLVDHSYSLGLYNINRKIMLKH